MVDWPDWCSWELELSPHLLKRMIDRQFNEADLRLMLQDAAGYRESVEEGRWIIETKLTGRSWELIVEPIHGEQVLLVVTAYSID